MRHHLTYANVVATLALCIAVGGGSAIAASVITSRQIKDGTIATRDLSSSARTALKGQRGARGAAGPPGSAGPVGARGPTGADGPQGPQGPQGTVGVAGSAGATGGQGLRGFSAWDPIPSGQTVTGHHVLDVDTATAAVSREFRTTVDLPGTIAPLLSTAVNFKDGATDDDATCTGTFAAPTAPPDQICAYLGGVGGGKAAGTTELQANRGQSLSGRQRSFSVFWEDSDGGDVFVELSWAYTAP